MNSELGTRNAELRTANSERGARNAERSEKPGADLLARTKAVGVRVIKLVDALPPKRSADAIGRQLIRSATSIGANYRAAKRARSTAEFCAKLGIVEEEADETSYWLELLVETGLMKAEKLSALQNEVNEITAMIVRSIKTARTRK